MEFKGTKGQWFIESTESYINEHGVKVDVISTDDTISLCEVYGDEYNAKLISKAPEMLDMLERTKKVINRLNPLEMDFEIDLLTDLEQLIKEATEI